jgi:hypothetical protein
LRRYRGAILAALFLLVLSPVVMIWSWETDRVDQCLTRGGTFDYAAMACDLARGDHAFVPFTERHPRFLTVTLAAAVVALGVGTMIMREPADGVRSPDRAGAA